MTLPDGERLLLTLDREVERECVLCNGRGGYVNGLGDDCQCFSCDQTGRLKRRLRGWVEVDTFVRQDADDGSYMGQGITVWPLHSDYEVFHGADFRAKAHEEAAAQVLRERIIAAYLAGTLPAEIAANLELSEVGTDV